jgi:hypothetical protein
MGLVDLLGHRKQVVDTDLSFLEKRLDDARQSQKLAEVLCASQFSHGNLQAWNDHRTAVLQLERQIAAVLKRPFAVPIVWDSPWTRSSDFRVFYCGINHSKIAYNCLLADAPAFKQIAIIGLTCTYAIRCGGGNDEVIEGHSLYGCGLDTCAAFTVQNSDWIRSEIEIHKVHPQFHESHWNDYQHFLWTFHDGQVEVIAKDYYVEQIYGSLDEFVQYRY